MDVSEYLDRSLYVEQHGWTHKQIFDTLSDAYDFVLFQVDVLSGFRVFGLEEGPDNVVDINLHFLAYHHSPIINIQSNQ